MRLENIIENNEKLKETLYKELVSLLQEEICNPATLRENLMLTVSEEVDPDDKWGDGEYAIVKKEVRKFIDDNFVNADAEARENNRDAREYEMEGLEAMRGAY